MNMQTFCLKQTWKLPLPFQGVWKVACFSISMPVFRSWEVTLAFFAVAREQVANPTNIARFLGGTVAFKATSPARLEEPSPRPQGVSGRLGSFRARPRMPRHRWPAPHPELHMEVE